MRFQVKSVQYSKNIFHIFRWNLKYTDLIWGIFRLLQVVLQIKFLDNLEKYNNFYLFCFQIKFYTKLNGKMQKVRVDGNIDSCKQCINNLNEVFAEDEELVNPQMLQKSSNLEQYEYHMSQIQTPSVPQLYKVIQSSQFKVIKEWRNTISSKLSSTDFESFTVELHLGYFKSNITVCNTSLNIDFEEQILIQNGGFGSVYKINLPQGQFAVKCFNFDQNNILQGHMKTIYQQYFMAKLFSSLQIGCKIVKPFGYDIILLKNKPIFCMQYCQQKNPKKQVITQFDQKCKNILFALKIAHSLHICHCDVKTANILWSPTYKKYILVDFGLSRMVSEDIGYTTLTRYLGTYRYASPQMKKLFILKTQSKIDLYFNDLHGFLKSAKIQKDRKNIFINEYEIDELNQSTNSSQKLNYLGRKQLSSLSLLTNLFRAKYSFYVGQIQQSLNILESQTQLIASVIQIIQKYFTRKKLSKTQYWKAETIYKVKKQTLLANKMFLHKLDRIFQNYIHTQAGKNQIFFLCYIIESQIQLFVNFLQNNQIKLKMYILINPFTAHSLQSILFQQDKYQKIQLKLMQKIYKGLKLGQDQNFYVRLRKVIHFFVDFIIKENNLELLQHSRSLLIYIKQPINYLQKVNNQLLNFYHKNYFQLSIKLMSYYFTSNCQQNHKMGTKLGICYLQKCIQTTNQVIQSYQNQDNIRQQKYVQAFKYYNIIKIINKMAHQLYNLSIRYELQGEQSQFSKKLTSIANLAQKLVVQQVAQCYRFELIVIKMKMNFLHYTNFVKQVNHNQNQINSTQCIKPKPDQLKSERIQSMVAQCFYKKQVYQKQISHYFNISDFKNQLSVYPSFNKLKFSKHPNQQDIVRLLQYYFNIYHQRIYQLCSEFWNNVYHHTKNNYYILNYVAQRFIQAYQSSIIANINLSQLSLNNFTHSFHVILQMVCQIQLAEIDLCNNFSKKQSILLSEMKIQKYEQILKINKQKISQIFTRSIQILTKQLGLKLIGLDLQQIQNSIINQRKHKQAVLIKENRLDISQFIISLKLNEALHYFKQNKGDRFLQLMQQIFAYIIIKQKYSLYYYLKYLIKFKFLKTNQTTLKIQEYIDYKIIQIVNYQRPECCKKLIQVGTLYQQINDKIVDVFSLLVAKNKIWQSRIFFKDILCYFNLMRCHKQYKDKLNCLISIIQIYCQKNNKKFLQQQFSYYLDINKFSLKNARQNNLLVFFLFKVASNYPNFFQICQLKRLLTIVGFILQFIKIYERQVIYKNYYELFNKTFMEDHKQDTKKQNIRLSNMRSQIKYCSQKRLAKLFNIFKTMLNRIKLQNNALVAKKTKLNLAIKIENINLNNKL